MKAKLILENGEIFEGISFGYEGEVLGEVVFNTSMNGYQEILTDPAGSGQILVMTYPLIGNYGINLDDSESSNPTVKAVIVNELCSYPNNFRCEFNLGDYLKSHKVAGIEGIDTRALTKALRNKGTMKGFIVTGDNHDFSAIKSLLEKSALVEEDVILPPAKTTIAGKGPISLALIDLGLTKSTLDKFVQMGCTIKIYPHTAHASEILAANPDLVILSSGSEQVKHPEHILEEIKILAQSKPLAGIGAGHQLIAKAFGGSLEKHLYGHRGKQPVKNLLSGRVSSTVQNHSWHVKRLPEDFELTHINLNDNSIEGMKHKVLPVASVQFYPENHTDSSFSDNVISEFLKLISREVKNA